MDQPALHATLGGQKYVSTNYWWEGDDFYFEADGKIIRCEGVYPVSIIYEGLDYKGQDVVLVYEGHKYQKKIPAGNNEELSA